MGPVGVILLCGSVHFLPARPSLICPHSDVLSRGFNPPLDPLSPEPSWMWVSRTSGALLYRGCLSLPVPPEPAGGRALAIRALFFSIFAAFASSRDVCFLLLGVLW